MRLPGVYDLTMTFHSTASTVRLFIGFAMVLIAVVVGVVLTFSAAGAAGLGFWDIAILNKFGTFLLIWNYNPVAYAGAIALAFVGGLVVHSGRR